MKFTLEIELGNAAMRTAEDVAERLERTAKKLRENGLIRNFYGRIGDRNGNTVGTWQVVE